AGEQWKTAARVREIMSKFYTDQPDGLAGNEDCGAMSSWYIYSALGFYPVDPTSGIYVFGSPLLSNYTIHLPANKKFEVLVKNNSDQN
ncbi:glycoside hydrolase domain-containing protein, partial [Pseudomonas aeruginosa]